MNSNNFSLSYPFVIWITGVSGSGKSSLADKLYTLLKKDASPIVCFDGDKLREILGFEPTEDSIFDYAEDYLKDIAHGLGPEYNKEFIKPEGFSEKFWYGLGMAIPTVLTYHPFIRGTAKVGQGLQAVRGIGKTARALRGTGRFLSAGSSLPAGIAITDITREIDDGSLADIATAGAYGYGTGKILNIANKLNIVPRMALILDRQLQNARKIKISIY